MPKFLKHNNNFVIRPSLPRNIIFSITCMAFSIFIIQLAHSGKTEVWTAYLVALLLTSGTLVLLSAHLPEASYLRLTKDGFEIRELFKSRFFNWDDVSPFVARRRFLGTTIEYIHIDPTTGQSLEQSLPNGYSISAARMLETMNEWRNRFSKNM